MDTVYINLTKREDRKRLVVGEMRAQGLKARRFAAKTGDEVNDKTVTRTWHSRLNCLYDRKTLPALHNMSKGERGCSGSHVALWKQCARKDDPSKPMLILEDDAVLWDRSGVLFPEMCHRLIAAVEQVYDVERACAAGGCGASRPSRPSRPSPHPCLLPTLGSPRDIPDHPIRSPLCIQSQTQTGGQVAR